MRQSYFILLVVTYYCSQGIAQTGFEAADEEESSFDQILTVNEEASAGTDDGKAKFKSTFFEGDIVLTAKSNIYPNRAGSRLQFGSASDINLLWPRKTIPYVLDDTIKFERERTTYKQLQKAFAEYAEKTCIKFKERTNERDYLRLFKGGGCWSLVGRNGGKQDLSIGVGCEDKGVIIHELMHALGFWHEQSRPDRDTFVEVVTDNIRDGFEDQFKKYDKGEIDSRGSPYDYKSIMHYGPSAFSKNGKDTLRIRSKSVKVKLGQRTGLSDLDVQQISNIYKCDVSAVNGNWGVWADYSTCSKKCGQGKQTRYRECNNPAPKNGGDQCPGKGKEEKDCYETVCTVDCDFDKGGCMWEQASDDDFNWKRRAGSTPSGGTGPSNDHTKGNAQGMYMYIEASSPRTLGDVARLESAPIQETSHSRCFSFWYNMFGPTIGTLAFIVKGASIKNVKWMLRGEQGQEWRKGQFQIDGNSGTFKVIIVGSVGREYRGDIAIDDVVLDPSGCNVQPPVADPSKTDVLTTTPAPPTVPTPDTGSPSLNCDFESLTCPWKNTYLRDFIDWRLYRGSTLSKDTGPDADHTTGTTRGYYLYIEGSSPQVTGDNARLVSPEISVDSVSQPRCLQFYYFMYGRTIGQLKVSILMKNGNEVMLWSLKGQQGASWQPARVPLPNGNMYRIVIEGVVGSSYLSDIAIDDIALLETTCLIHPFRASTKKVAKTTTPAPVPTTTAAPVGSSNVVIDVTGMACNDPSGHSRDQHLSSQGGLPNPGLDVLGRGIGFNTGGTPKKFNSGRNRRQRLGFRGLRSDDFPDDGDLGDDGDGLFKSGITSGGAFDSRTQSGCQQARSSIKINGMEYSSMKEGHNLVLVNARTGKVFGRGHFSTKSNIFATSNMENYINGLPAYTLFAIATQGDADSKLSSSSRKYLPPRGGSLAIVGYRGAQKIEWVKRDDNTNGNGPSQLKIKFSLVIKSSSIKKIILLKKESFSGTTFLPIPAKYSPLLNMGKTDFTIAAWIKTTKDGTIISKAGRSSHSDVKAIYIADGKVNIKLTDAFLEKGRDFITDGNWHHIIVLGRGETRPFSVSLYVDGRLDWQKSYTPVRDDPSHTLKIAHTLASFPKNPTFKGEIRSLSYFDKIVSQDVIMELLKDRPI